MLAFKDKHILSFHFTGNLYILHNINISLFPLVKILLLSKLSISTP